MKRTQCDSCGKTFKINLKEEKHGKGIKETYFKCPHCKERYFVSILDSDLRRMQREVKFLVQDKQAAAKEYTTGKITEESYKQKIDDIQEKIKGKQAGMKAKMNSLKQHVKK